MRATKRLLLVTGEYPPLRGGVGDYTAQLGQALAERGWDVAVVTSALPGSDASVVPVRYTVSSWGWALWQRLRVLRRSGWWGIVHLQYQTGAFGMHPGVNALPVFARPFPVVTTFHDTRAPYLFPKAGAWRERVNRWLARSSAAVIVTNPEDQAIVAQWDVPESRLCRIPIGANIPPPRDPAGARASLDVKPETPIVAFFGFRTAEKGLDTLVEALTCLPEPRPTLLLVGAELADTDRAHRVDAERLRALLAETSLRVLDLGFRPAQEVADLLAAADVVALPFRAGASLRNGTLVAALCCGAAVITTRPSRQEWLDPLRDGEHLVLVPPNDPAALARALVALLGDAVRRNGLRRAAQAIAPLFAWERIAAQHEELYRDVLARFVS